MTDTQLLLVGLAMMVGLFGVLLPVIPGVLLIWGAGLVWALSEEGTGRWIVLGILTVLALIGATAKFVMSSKRVQRTGAPGATLLFGVIGAVVGFFVIPVLGLLIGGVAGIFLAERIRLGSSGAAWTATRALLVGLGLGMLVELVCGLLMIATWFVAVLADRL